MQWKEFDHPYVTVDVLIFSIRDGRLVIRLVRRGEPPFAGAWALPGVFVGLKESLDQAAARVALEKGSVADVYLEQLFSFGEPKRDPRARVISSAYFALLPEEKAKQVVGGQDAGWFAVEKLPGLAFDHKEIIKTGVARLMAKITYSSIAVSLLPRQFRLSELQRVYEIILGRALDKRNFRKKMLSLDLLKSVGKKDWGQKRRPAMLFSFKTTKTVFFG